MEMKLPELTMTQSKIGLNASKLKVVVLVVPQTKSPPALAATHSYGDSSAAGLP